MGSDASESTQLARERTELAHDRTGLADERTDLAIQRTVLAQERTLMAWVRTATSLISFGFSIYKFFDLQQQNPLDRYRLLGPRGFSMAMTLTGLISLILAIIQDRQ